MYMEYDLLSHITYSPLLLTIKQLLAPISYDLHRFHFLTVDCANCLSFVVLEVGICCILF